MQKYKEVCKYCGGNVSVNSLEYLSLRRGWSGAHAKHRALPVSRSSLHWLALIAFFLSLFCISSLAAAQSRLGEDIPFQWYEDASATLDIDGFMALPPEATTEQRTILSVGYTRAPVWLSFVLPASLFQGQQRWLQIGPNFLDEITLFYRPVAGGAWTMHRAGDTWPDAAGDMDYRFPVFALPAPLDAAGYEAAIKVKSTSAVLVDASLWTPEAFLKDAARDTAFWSFYFGLAAVSTALAIFAAFLLRRPLAWALCAFSLTYWLVACIQGYVDWLFGGRGFLVQHYLTGILTLLAYTSLLWVTIEALNLRERRKRLHRAMVWLMSFSLLLPLSIPLDLYSLAVQVQSVLCISTALVLAAGAWSIWRDEERNIMTLLLGTMPVLYVVAGMVALMSLFGLIPYNQHLYGLWQYVIMVNMITVLGWAAHRIRHEARETQEKRQLEKELRLEREASFHQRQFIGMVSHEFRNPLAVITHAMDNLALPFMSEAQRTRRYQSIRRATHRLVQLTDNCLADSRLDADGLQLQIGPTRLLDVVRSAAEIVDGSEVHRWRLTVQGLSASDMPAHDIVVQADAAMVRIALSNLLDNAVKYSNEGCVDIDVAFRGEFAVVNIRDHGAGIAAQDTALIFERHRRPEVSSSHRSDPGGSGLGLYVSRQIAQAHGGDVKLASSGPGGSCFEFSIPYPSGALGDDTNK